MTRQVKLKITDRFKQVFKSAFAAATPQSFFQSLFQRWESRYFKAQPTDFTAQVEAFESFVYACASAISESVADVPLKLYYQKGDERKEIKNHIFFDLWQNVNPFMNNFELRELTEIHQLLTGNAYWYIVKNAIGIPQEIYIVPSQNMKIIPDAQGFVKGYVYTAEGGNEIAFNPDEIIHFKYPNPMNSFYGMSPVIAGAYEIDANKYMLQYENNFFKNDARPLGLLTSEQVINDPEADRMRARWESIYKGVDNAGKIAILGKGLEYKQIQMSQTDLRFIEGRNMTRDNILTIFRVPKTIVAISDDVNRANAEASEYVFALRCIKPKLKRSQEKINEKLLPMYKQANGGRLYVEYAENVPMNKELEVKNRESRLTHYITTINEEREREGLAPVEWGNIPLAPINIAPLGSQPPQELPPESDPSDDDSPDDDPKAARKSEKDFAKLAIAIQYKARFESEVYVFRRVMRQLFEQQEREVKNNIEQYFKSARGTNKGGDQVDLFLFSRTEAEKQFIVATTDIYEQSYEAGAKDGLSRARMGGTPFNIDNPVAQRFLREKKIKLSFEVNDYTLQQLRDTLAEGLKNGEAALQMTQRVEKVFEFSKLYRAERIARTEVGAVENRSLVDVWGKAQIQKKQWLHTGGGFEPRPEHVAMNGETVLMSQPFSNGLMFPNDPNADPSETCNCTCSMIPII
jgi:HK97 family phage portal protein